MSKIRFVGLDVHADTIAVAVAEPGGEVRSHGVIPNRIESIGKLGPGKQIKACYEAGYYWQLTQLGVACQVIAPSLVGSGRDRVKDGSSPMRRSWRDVIERANYMVVFAADAAHEALRDLVELVRPQEGSVEVTSPAREVSAAAWLAAGRREGLDQAAIWSRSKHMYTLTNRRWRPRCWITCIKWNTLPRESYNAWSIRGTPT